MSMGILDGLYAAGIGEQSAEPTGPTPMHAIAAIRTTDKLGAIVHREISRYGTANFQRFWSQFYNGWLTYKALQADRIARSDPERVLEIDLPKYVRGFYGWRDALNRERGAGAAAGAQTQQALNSVPGQKITPSTWRTIAILGGLVVGGVCVRTWWQVRQEEKAHEEEARRAEERDRAIALIQQANQAQAAVPYAVAPPAYRPFYRDEVPAAPATEHMD